MNAPAFGIYVHIPFCVTVCPYCDFNVYAGIQSTAPAYIDAVIAEARARAGEATAPAGSIFLGGGTPTLLAPDLVAHLLRELCAIYDVDAGAEVTIEANPETVDGDLLRGFRDAGVNRVSLGVQSFAPHVLAMLGRAHSPAQARESVAAARAAGFDNVSIDLIFGTPGETPSDWHATLDDAIALQTDHVSCYSLMIEDGTAFGRAVKAGTMNAPDDDDVAEKFEHACDRIPLPHYEISNWGAMPSRHNLVYWTQGDYVGLGAGAHSHRIGTRSWNHKRPATYMEHASSGATAGSETLDDQTRADEWLQLRLRLLEPLDLDVASRRTGRHCFAAAQEMERAGLVTLDGAAMSLTRRGLLIENEVCVRLTSSSLQASSS